MSRPSKTICPAVGSSRRVSSRPVVLLPQPDSPTREASRPRARRSRGRRPPGRRRPGAGAAPLRIGKCLTRPGDREQVVGSLGTLRAAGALGGRVGESHGSCSFLTAAAGSRRARSRWRSVSAGGRRRSALARCRSRSGRSVLGRPPFCSRSAQRGLNAQPLRHVDQARRGALDRQQPLGALPVEARHRAEQAPGVGVLRVVEDVLGGAVLRPPGRRTSPGCRRRARRPRRGRG